MEKSLNIFGVSLFVAVPILAGVVSYQFNAEAEYAPVPAPSPSFNQRNKLVGVFYYYWWDNSSSNPEVQCDNWLGVRLTPEEGYYTSTYAYMKEHISQMKKVGIDFALLSFRDYYLERYIAFTQASEEMDFHFAPMIELSDLKQRQEYLAIAPTGRPFAEEPLSLTSKTKAKIVSMIDSALEPRDSPAFLIYEKKPVVFLNGVCDFYPGWEGEAEQFLAQSVVELYKKENQCDEISALEIISQNWGKKLTSVDDMVCYFYPHSTMAFYNPQNRIEQDWAKGFEYGWRQFWHDIQSEVEHRQGDIFWVSDVGEWWQSGIEDRVDISSQISDALFLCPSSLAQSNAISSQQVLDYWKLQTESLCKWNKERKTATIVTTMPCYSQQGSGIGVKISVETEGKLSYNLLWEIALHNEPNIVLIASWNNYYDNSCIEPTKEFGQLFIERTKYWTSAFKAPIPLGSLISSDLEAE